MAASFPKPYPGMVISYSYLWSDQHARGKEEGLKNRPCVILNATPIENNKFHVVILPITTVPRGSAQDAVELPEMIVRCLGMPNKRCWVSLNEINQFTWVGPDVRALTYKKTSNFYGSLSSRFFRKIRDAFVQTYEQNKVAAVKRTEGLNRQTPRPAAVAAR